ncbi:MAG: LEA type 2 family protein [Treponema sp.]|nr:LEA type 2 family protein [Treponema sp.]
MRNFLFFILTALVVLSCKTSPPNVPAVNVIEPVFDVSSIYIIQADIVVTEFEAVIKIDNPNTFPVELSSIVYELFGNNIFWAGNTANDILVIPALSSGETRFKFTMNFIDTNRRLLDDVIAMRRVNYRFRGTAQMRSMTAGNITPFSVNFDCSGLSEVKRTSN